MTITENYFRLQAFLNILNKDQILRPPPARTHSVTHNQTPGDKPHADGAYEMPTETLLSTKNEG